MSGRELPPVYHSKEAEPVRTTDCSDGNRYAYGIAGICEIFGCSRPTAQRLKKSGIIKVSTPLSSSCVPFEGVISVKNI